VIARVAIGPGIEVLDAGCASGVFAQRAAAARARVTGVDASAALIEHARRRVPTASFSVGELEEPPYAEASCEAAASVKSLGVLLPPPPPGAPGPFALSAEGALERLAASAGLDVTERAEAVTVWEYADDETALRGLLAPGPAVRAIAAAGEEAVRAGILEALAPFRTRDGGYRLENTFVYVVAGGRSSNGASNGP
jgi:SAM-dependent methyltransferase